MPVMQSTGQTKSFYLDVGRSDDLFPFIGIFRNELAKLGECHRLRNTTYLGESSPHRGVAKKGIDLAVELVDNIGRGIPKRDKTIPHVCFVVR